MYSPFRHLGAAIWKYSPVHLTFFLTRRCNQRCPFCFYLSHDTGSEESELTIDEIEKLSSSMGRLLWLAFSGGEIFLRNDLVEITREFYEKNKPSIILFPTNGILTDVIRKKIETILGFCEKSVIVVKLSLDGTEYVHESIRGKGSFQKVMQTYGELGELLERYPNFELGINTVFCAENQDNMDSLIAFVNALDKIKTHTVSLIRGRVADSRLKDVDINNYDRILRKMELNLKHKTASIYRFKGAKLKAAQDILQRRLIYETIRQDRQLIPCYAGRLNVVITETGDVYPCEFFDSNMRLGNVRDKGYDVKMILRADKAKKTINSIRYEGCYCTHECYVMTNILFNPKCYPSLVKEYLKIR